MLHKLVCSFTRVRNKKIDIRNSPSNQFYSFDVHLQYILDNIIDNRNGYGDNFIKYDFLGEEVLYFDTPLEYDLTQDFRNLNFDFQKTKNFISTNTSLRSFRHPVWIFIQYHDNIFTEIRAAGNLVVNSDWTKVAFYFLTECFAEQGGGSEFLVFEGHYKKALSIKVHTELDKLIFREFKSN